MNTRNVLKIFIEKFYLLNLMSIVVSFEYLFLIFRGFQDIIELKIKLVYILLLLKIKPLKLVSNIFYCVMRTISLKQTIKLIKFVFVIINFTGIRNGSDSYKKLDNNKIAQLFQHLFCNKYIPEMLASHYQNLFFMRMYLILKREILHLDVIRNPLPFVFYNKPKSH